MLSKFYSEPMDREEIMAYMSENNLDSIYVIDITGAIKQIQHLPVFGSGYGENDPFSTCIVEFNMGPDQVYRIINTMSMHDMVKDMAREVASITVMHIGDGEMFVHTVDRDVHGNFVWPVGFHRIWNDQFILLGMALKPLF